MEVPRLVAPKSYSELVQIPDYIGRYEYLKTSQIIGEETFGHMRYLNQIFYHSDEWLRIRRDVIIRDSARDLAMPDDFYLIKGRIYIHHINPITLQDILNRDPKCYDLENLVCVHNITHKAIHYGDKCLLPFQQMIDRVPNDTCPWKTIGEPSK